MTRAVQLAAPSDKRSGKGNAQAKPPRLLYAFKAWHANNITAAVIKRQGVKVILDAEGSTKATTSGHHKCHGMKVILDTGERHECISSGRRLL